MPNSRHPSAKKALAEIWGAEDETCALAAVSSFRGVRGEVRKATAKITDDVAELLACYDYPAEHWIDPPTHHEPDRLDFATLRHRTKITRGPGSTA